MKFGELKEILSNDRAVIIFDDDGTRRTTYVPTRIDSTYDECNVYKLGIDDGAFAAYVEIPTWTVHGTITLDVEFEIKALSEEDALEGADYIRAEVNSYDNEMRVVSSGADIDSIYLGYANVDWEDATENEE